MLKLDLDKKTEKRFYKLLNLHGKSHSSVINSMIDYRINELEKGIKNIEFDFAIFERKYNIKTDEFFEKYQSGEFENRSHENDFMIWSGEYEAYLEFQNELKELK